MYCSFLVIGSDSVLRIVLLVCLGLVALGFVGKILCSIVAAFSSSSKTANKYYCVGNLLLYHQL